MALTFLEMLKYRKVKWESVFYDNVAFLILIFTCPNKAIHYFSEEQGQ